MLKRVFRRDLPRLLGLNLRYLGFFAAECFSDSRLGIDTRTTFRGYESLDGHSMAGDRASANPYVPTPYGTLRRMFDALPADLSAYSFVDFGSGRGRTLVVAAGRGFKQVIGVEFVEAFHASAERNITAAGVRGRAKSVLMDARDFRIPTDPCVLFFFNPFGRDVMEVVARAITKSCREAPRPVIVALYNDITADVFAEGGSFRLIRTLREPWLASLGHTGRYSIRMLEAAAAKEPSERRTQ